MKGHVLEGHFYTTFYDKMGFLNILLIQYVLVEDHVRGGPLLYQPTFIDCASDYPLIICNFENHSEVFAICFEKKIETLLFDIDYRLGLKELPPYSTKIRQFFQFYHTLWDTISPNKHISVNIRW